MCALALATYWLPRHGKSVAEFGPLDYNLRAPRSFSTCEVQEAFRPIVLKSCIVTVRLLIVEHIDRHGRQAVRLV